MSGIGGAVGRVAAGLCVCAVAVGAQDDEAAAAPWFEDGEELTEAVEDGLEDWFETERRYLDNVVRMSVELDGEFAVPTATRVCFQGATWKEAEGDPPPGSTVVAAPGGDGAAGRDGDEGGADGEDGEDAKIRIVDEMHYVELYDEPFETTLELSKSGRDKLVPVRVWVGRRYSEKVGDGRWLGTSDVEKAEEAHPMPPVAPEGEQDWGRSYGGTIGETDDDEELVMFVDVPLAHLPPLTSVQVWIIGTVGVSGTKEDVAERAIVDLMASRKRAVVFNRAMYEERDEGLFDGPVTLVQFGKVFDPDDTLEPEIVFGEEKNYRSMTLYAASASYGVVRASAFEGLMRDGRYMATRDFRDFRDVFGRNDVVELEYKKNNFETLDDFNMTTTLWKDFWHDHAYKKGRGRR